MATKKKTIPLQESPFYVQSWLGTSMAPLLEMGLFFILFFIYIAFGGIHDRMISSPIHPFWVIVILMSVQYGAAEGLVAVALSTILLYAGNLPTQGIGEDFFDYQFRLYRLPFMWLATALILGELQERKTRIRRELEKKLHETEVREDEITRSYQTLKTIKESLESRLAGQMSSSVATYEALKMMEELKPAKVLLGVDELVRNVLNPEKYSLFALGPNGLEAVTDWGWTESDNYIRRFPPSSDLYINLVGKQKLLCVLNREDEVVLRGEGILAAPLMDSSGTIFGALKIEALDLEELNLSQIETFRSIASFAGVAYAQATSHQKLLRNTINDEELPIFSPAFYEIMKEQTAALCQLEHQPLGAVHILAQGQNRLSKEILLQLIERLGKISLEKFGPLYQLFRKKRMINEFILLIPFISSEKLQERVAALRQDLEAWNKITDLKIDIEWIIAEEKKG